MRKNVTITAREVKAGMKPANCSYRVKHVNVMPSGVLSIVLTDNMVLPRFPDEDFTIEV